MEYKAFENKILKNGMTIMVIDKLPNYINEWRNLDPSKYSGANLHAYTVFDTCYIKGKIIKIDNLYGDSKLANEIGLEVSKGFFINVNDK